MEDFETNENSNNQDPLFELEAAYKVILKVKLINKHIHSDPNDEGVLKTPHRAAKAILDMTSGRFADIKTIINNAIYPADHKGIVKIYNLGPYQRNYCKIIM